ncbi:unnamed protein product [Paramecium pentaurelia]|uniref:Uncharacterized protein n=1 Tax=Paramecium pentaurelia TaxID=43138 RepID=A0A8S1WXW8_9CILI|nr:unnamed protein product [Paramecium pentaurelia]
MKVSLDHDVYKWLLSLTIVKPQQVKNTGKVELDENQSKLFVNGIKFGEALNKMLEARSIHVPNLSDQMKNQLTPGVKLFNWNILQDAFQKINLPLDNDIKNLIVNGDTEMMNELLKDMMELDNQINRKSQTRGSVRSSEDSSFETQKKPPSRPASKLPQTKYDIQGNNNELILDELDTKKPLNESKSLLEFFITGLSKHLTLKPQQAASLLSNGNKYLAHLLVKGVKGEFETLINWLSDIYANISRVFNFLEQQDSNIHYFFATIKPGLLSKEQEITLWTLRIMGRTYFELSEMEMHQLGYEWFCKENGGLAATFLCMQRHPNLLSQICELYSQVARFNIVDFFTVQFKKQLADKCVDMLNSLIEFLYQQKTLKDELISQGIVQYWAQAALKMSDSDQLPIKIQGLKYLTLNWLLYPIQFEEDQNYPNQYLFLMKKGTRDSSNNLKYFSLNMLFRLLDKLATDRNPYAAVLYKKLTFTLIENYNELDVREFMLNNFMYLIQKYSSIPIDILLEPLIKQVMLNDALVNLTDMILFKFISKHPKMKIRLAILLLDLLAKIYLNSVTMSHLSFNPIQVLLARFAESPMLREYAFKLCKIGLALHYGSLKSKRQQVKTNDLSILTALQQHNNDHEILEAQKRAQIIELIKFIINMQQDELNEQIKPLLCHFYIELQNINIKDKGVITLLNMFGNPEKIVQVIKQQWEADKQEQDEILKQSQLIIDNEFVQNQQLHSAEQTPQTIKSEKKQQNDGDPFNDLRQKELEDEKKFLAQNGVGFKKRVVELERGKQPIASTQNTQSQQVKKKPQQVDPKVLENIANIKLKKEEELLKKQQEEEEKRKRIEILQKKAQQEIQKRTTGKAIDKVDEKKVELIDLDDHETHDYESMSVAIKKNHKAMKYLFSKYSNTTNQASKKQYFGELQEQYEIIQLSDIMRMLKDYQVNMQKEEVQAYVKAINQKYSENKTDQFSLDQQNFERFLAQLSMKIEVYTFQRRPAGQCLEQFMQSFGSIAKSKNENHLIFLDPDNINIDPDRDIIRQLNLQLQTQDVPVPSKFKKVTEKQLNQQYEYRQQAILGIENAWLDCHEIVNQLISDTFKTNVMEPLSDIKIIWKVKPNPQQQQEQVVQVKQRDNSQQKKVINRAIEDKLLKQQEEEQKKQEAEEKRKKHQEKLKQEYLRKKKEKEEQEQLKKQEDRQEMIEKAEREKKQQELLKKEAEEKKLKLREYKEKMAEESKIKEAQNIEMQKQKQELERKQREEFQKKQKEEVSKLLEQKKKEFKDKEQQEKQKEQKAKEEIKEWKNNVEVMLQQEQEVRQREKQMHQKIQQLQQNQDIQQVYKKYEKQLQAIYHAYQEYTDWKIENAGVEKELLQFKGFTNFASQFSIYPAIITPEDAQLIFRSITRERERQQQQLNEKNGFNAVPPKGMNYHEFQQALLRVAIKGQKYFDLLNEKYENNMKTIDMIALKKDQAIQEEGPLEKREDQYQQVDATSSKTMQGLMYFLDMPEEKTEMNSKLRALKLEFQKVAAQRDKKQMVQQKLTDEVKQPTKRKQSIGQKEGKDKSQEKQQPQRNKSQNIRVDSAQNKMKSSQKDQIQAVDENELNKQSPKKIETTGPDGKKESWKVNQQKQ